MRGQTDESVLVVQTLGAPPPPLRRRRRPRRTELGTEPPSLALTRVTAVRAFAPFAAEAEAERWLDEVLEAEDTIDALLDDGIALLNRALYAQAIAAADPYGAQLRREVAATARIGFGGGDALAAGRFAVAREVDPRAGVAPRRRRDQELRPQERVAALLGERAGVDVCEPLLLRARADFDAGRTREAALQLRVGLEALLAELAGALSDADHERDIGTLRERRGEVGALANAALAGSIDGEGVNTIRELLETCERVLRRRRVLGE